MTVFSWWKKIEAEASTKLRLSRVHSDEHNSTSNNFGDHQSWAELQRSSAQGTMLKRQRVSYQRRTFASCLCSHLRAYSKTHPNQDPILTVRNILEWNFYHRHCWTYKLTSNSIYKYAGFGCQTAMHIQHYTLHSSWFYLNFKIEKNESKLSIFCRMPKNSIRSSFQSWCIHLTNLNRKLFLLAGFLDVHEEEKLKLAWNLILEIHT